MMHGAFYGRKLRLQSRCIFFNTRCDCEMRERFSDITISLIKSINSLNPKSGNFLKVDLLTPLLHQYHKSLPSTGNIQKEATTLQNFLSRNPMPEDKNEMCYLLEHIDPIKEAFPILRECLMVALTFGTSNATVERSFSSLRQIKTYLRSTMSQERLDSLALLSIERSFSSRLWDCLDDLVMKFACKHSNSKIVLL